MTLRLKYADLDTKKIETETDIISALNKALDRLKDKETLYILPTYTAMLELRKHLTKEGAVEGFWKEKK
jgi:UDP-N-acetylmuramyl tripeptide synthase